ncbi:MAG: hypothetical protein EOQ29_33630 [Mesorhizobium sp.]|nr:hypothetical protein EJ071_15465 [Mesorhizobium sp. M1B.F.Ca.ET.045.04.1.1]RWA59804.1 MAG: hypothetical protein EOQ29_33630 [Mesorhizobium sp.]RWB15905.1 MAG: hypothetical protein EOQ40_27965 [Mesorhizobium sp.]TIT86303.1 MAG: hypothetical protein E5W55_30875 [Mesorhizobium sp.]
MPRRTLGSIRRRGSANATCHGRCGDEKLHTYNYDGSGRPIANNWAWRPVAGMTASILR